ncbi:MAG: Crp/Fnr family transcriptional regulator [Armatimonadota bacterium]
MDRTISDTLKSTFLFNQLPEKEFLEVRAIAKRISQPQNTVIFYEGEECNGMYIVEEGAVKVYKESPDGKEHVVHVALPYDTVAEAAIFLDEGYPATASAIKKTSLIFLPKRDFINLLQQKPSLSFNLMAAMARRSQMLLRNIESLALKDSGSRLADFLLTESKNQSSPKIKLHITKQTLAAKLGIASETLSRLLARLEAENIIQVTGKEIIINNKTELENLINI